MTSGLLRGMQTGRWPRCFPGRILAYVVLGGCLASGTSVLLAQQDKTTKSRQQEESEDYFKKWLTEDVVYIISPEEKKIFLELTTDEEREQFIEQFWLRRDPDPRTPTNEVKQEHYRRIAYVNEHFSAGWPGWRTDRGRVYIIHGEPDEIEELPSGGHYERTLHEGGGRTSVYPYQKWRYRYIERIGENVEIEFVDRDFSGVYRLALSPEEKDAFLFVPNAGYTAAEELGLASRSQRPYFTPGFSYPLMNYRAQDRPFERYERFVDVQRPAELKYPDLRNSVDLKITYNEVPLKAKVSVFRLNEARSLVPLTLEIEHSDLTFKQSPLAASAKVAVYGIVSNLSNRVAAEFEDEVVASFNPRDLEQGMRGSSAYNRVLTLDTGNRYKMQVVIKDLNSDRVGHVTLPITTSAGGAEALDASEIVLSDFIVPVDDVKTSDQQFVLGNVRVRPRLSREFGPDEYFAVYLQIYNVAIDQSSQNPAFEARYRLIQDGEIKFESTDRSGVSVQYFSSRRMVLIKRLPLNEIPPGNYTVEVVFTDKIQEQTVTRRQAMTLRGTPASSAR